MKIYRPLWEDGAALAPQQFQQQARWSEYVAGMVARMGFSHSWGVVAAEFDDAALALARLNATRLVVRFQDGTIVDTELADNIPPVCDLSAANGSDAVEVVAALPLLNASGGNDDILALEPEAVALADSEGPDAALGWLQFRPDMVTDRQKWLLRLLMGRIAEQYGKNELAVHLFAELGERAREVTLSEWEPELLFEVQARHLKLLRLKAGRSEADKARLTPVMDQLLVGLIAVDPARAAVLCC